MISFVGKSVDPFLSWLFNLAPPWLSCGCRKTGNNLDLSRRSIRSNPHKYMCCRSNGSKGLSRRATFLAQASCRRRPHIFRICQSLDPASFFTLAACSSLYSSKHSFSAEQSLQTSALYSSRQKPMCFIFSIII